MAGNVRNDAHISAEDFINLHEEEHSSAMRIGIIAASIIASLCIIFSILLVTNVFGGGSSHCFSSAGLAVVSVIGWVIVAICCMRNRADKKVDA